MVVESGEDVNQAGKYGKTALVLAARNGHENCATMLIQLLLYHAAPMKQRFNNFTVAAKVELDHQDKGGWTALIFTATEGRTKCAKLLLRELLRTVSIKGVHETVSLASERKGVC